MIVLLCNAEKTDRFFFGQAAQGKLIIDDIILIQIDWSACARDLYASRKKSLTSGWERNEYTKKTEVVNVSRPRHESRAFTKKNWNHNREIERRSKKQMKKQKKSSKLRLPCDEDASRMWIKVKGSWSHYRLEAAKKMKNSYSGIWFLVWRIMRIQDLKLC